jgi:hypothetical protein
LTVFIEDSPRAYQVPWMSDAVNAGNASAAIITPWASPYAHRGGPGVKPGLLNRVAELNTAGIPVWVDPVTHALQMTGVGDFRYYSAFDLWGGPVGDLTQDLYRREHVRRVFRLQDEAGAQHLAPAPLLPAALNNLSTLALETSTAAMEADPGAWLTIAGSGTFWGDGSDLDAHIGALAALTPAGWFLSFAVPDNDLPPKLTPSQVFGVCRTVRALSEYAPVHVSHGDLAALPAVAAGATSTGTGWDKRQRVQAFSDYAVRAAPTGRASWYERPTVLGLLGTLSKRDGELLLRQDPTLATVLGGLPSVPGPKPSFLHHVTQLNSAVNRVLGAANLEARARTLDAMYTAAVTNWGAVNSSTAIRDMSTAWISPFQQGLRAYASSEGWVL